MSLFPGEITPPPLAHTPGAEDRIRQAARRVFLAQGFSGARMQAIADEAGQNKALLHYYFRSKEKLYREVFDPAYERFALALHQLDRAELSLAEKIERFVLEVWKMAGEDPSMLLFVTTEIARGPAGPPIQLVKLRELQIVQQLRDLSKQGLLPQVDPVQVLLQLFALVLTPLQSGPTLMRLLEADPEAYKLLLRAYYERLPKLVMASLK
jgi:TetR/AcrR family transcriptional regulator